MQAMFEEMLRRAADTGRDEERSKTRILPEAAVARLAELLPAFTAGGPRFGRGDLVTPRRDSTVRGAGEPHLVVDVLTDPDRRPRFDQGDPGSNGWGMLIDMRVIHMDGDRVVAHWVESSSFQPYTEASRG